MILGNAIAPFKFTPSGAAANPLWTGLQNAYKLESDSSDSVGGVNGTDQNGPTYAAGKNNNAVTYDGVDQWAKFPSGSHHFPDDFTISAWFNRDAVDNDVLCIYNNWFSTDAINYYGISISSWQGNQFYVFVGDGAYELDIMQTGSVITAGTWNNVITTWDKSTKTISITLNDAIPDTNVFGNDLTYNASDEPAIGVRHYASAGNANFFKGKIDEVYMWNRILTASEITELQTTFY